MFELRLRGLSPRVEGRMRLSSSQENESGVLQSLLPVPKPSFIVL
jgi:hypothetical protein